MSFSERDLQSKLDDMEAKMKDNSVKNSADANFNPRTLPQMEINPSPKIQGLIDNSKAWFTALPKVGKAAVAIGGIWLGFSVLGAIFHVVSSIISIGIVGLVLYVAYRLFTNKSESN